METLKKPKLFHSEFAKNLEMLTEEYLKDRNLLINNDDFDVFDSKKALEGYFNFFTEEKMNEIADIFVEGYKEEEALEKEGIPLADPNKLNDSIAELLFDPIEAYMKYFFPNKNLLAFAFFNRNFTQNDTEKEIVSSALQYIEEWFGDDQESTLFAAIEFVELAEWKMFNRNYSIGERMVDALQLAEKLRKTAISDSLDCINSYLLSPYV